jgi:signal peptidase I
MILDAIEPVVMAFAVFMVVYLVLAQPHKVDGNSMYPTFHDKELILTDKLSYKLGKPSRGDVVVFHAPEPWKSDFIKRIIGLPGETIMVKNGLVYVNGEQLSEPYLPAGLKTNEKATLREGIPYAIPADRYMVFGDNRNFSSDSREWGAVKTSALVGKALFVYWPIDRIRLIEHEKYNL